MRYSIFVFLLLLSGMCSGQLNGSSFWDHVRFGGGLGLGFGNNTTAVNLAPSAIYEFNQQFALGVGLNGSYLSRRDQYNSWILGGSLIGLFNPIQELQLSAELEPVNVDINYDDSVANLDENYWYTALFIGAGYRTGNVAFGIRYDVLYDEDQSIYTEPWLPFVRFYF